MARGVRSGPAESIDPAFDGVFQDRACVITRELVKIAIGFLNEVALRVAGPGVGSAFNAGVEHLEASVEKRVWQL